jgi:hypothetical protein
VRLILVVRNKSSRGLPPPTDPTSFPDLVGPVISLDRFERGGLPAPVLALVSWSAAESRWPFQAVAAVNAMDDGWDGMVPGAEQ